MADPTPVEQARDLKLRPGALARRRPPRPARHARAALGKAMGRPAVHLLALGVAFVAALLYALRSGGLLFDYRGDLYQAGIAILHGRNPYHPGFLAALAVGVAAESNRQRPDWRAVARVLSADGTRAAYMVDGCHLLPLSVYVPGLRFAPAPGVPVPEVDVITAAGQDSWTAVLRADSYVQCRPTAPRQVVPRQLGQLRERGGPVHIGLFTVTRLTSARPDRISRSSFAAAGLPGALMVIGPGSASAPSDASIAP